MPYRICKMIELESGHMLTKHSGNCKCPHGHSRQIEITMESDTLDQNEMVCDFAVVKDAMKEFLEAFDHSMCINTKDPMYASFKKAYGDRIIPFEGIDPTTEVIAKLIFDHVKACFHKYAGGQHDRHPLPHGVRVVKVRVWETRTTWAEYSEQDKGRAGASPAET